MNMSTSQTKTSEAESPQSTPASGPARMMSNQMAIYYSNCALVATSPRDISLFFGRFVPVPDKGSQGLGELYERQIYMTVEQAEDLARMLTQTVKMYRARQTGAQQENKG
ncbi:MAG: DUF3467 domain-containing protein [Thermodesulfobacteriota bacterium]